MKVFNQDFPFPLLRLCSPVWNPQIPLPTSPHPLTEKEPLKQLWSNSSSLRKSTWTFTTVDGSEIMRQLIWQISHFLQGFVHPMWFYTSQIHFPANPSKAPLLKSLVPTKRLSEIVGSQSNDWWSSHMHSGPWHPASQSLDGDPIVQGGGDLLTQIWGSENSFWQIDDGWWWWMISKSELILRGIRILPLNKHWTFIVLKLYIYISPSIAIICELNLSILWRYVTKS